MNHKCEREVFDYTIGKIMIDTIVNEPENYPASSLFLHELQNKGSLRSWILGIAKKEIKEIDLTMAATLWAAHQKHKKLYDIELDSDELEVTVYMMDIILGAIKSGIELDQFVVFKDDWHARDMFLGCEGKIFMSFPEFAVEKLNSEHLAVCKSTEENIMPRNRAERRKKKK